MNELYAIRITSQLRCYRDFLAVQWLRLHPPNARGTGLIPDWGTKIPQAAWHGQKKKKDVIIKQP